MIEALLTLDHLMDYQIPESASIAAPYSVAGSAPAMVGPAVGGPVTGSPIWGAELFSGGGVSALALVGVNAAEQVKTVNTQSAQDITITGSSLPAPQNEQAEEAAKEEEAPKTPINPYGRTVVLEMPVRSDVAELGNATIRLGADDTLAIERSDLIELLTPIADQQLLAGITSLPSSDGFLDFAALQAVGVLISYDSARVEVILGVKANERSESDISLAGSNRERVGTYDAPAGVSGYFNIRGAIGYNSIGGNSDLRPLFDITNVLRAGGVVLENNYSLTFGTEGGSRLRRSYSRLVYDRPDLNLRFSAGDIFASSIGSISAPSLFGVGVAQMQNMFDPQRNLTLNSYQSFRLNTPSTVEVLVNGTTVRRISLQPGNYRLSDFPLVRGSNDVQIVATNDFGRQELAAFSQFFNFSLLPKGVDEFAAGIGFPENSSSFNRNYDFNRETGYFFYRRGLSNQLTMGSSIVADEYTQAGGLLANFGTPFGIFQIEAGASRDVISDFGYNLRASYSYSPSSGTGFFTGINASAEYTSDKYSYVGRFAPVSNSTVLTTSINTSFRLSDRDFFSLGGTYSKNRNGSRDRYEASARYSRRISGSTTVNGWVSYSRNDFQGKGVYFGLGLSRRFGQRGFGSAQYSSRDEALRLNYSSNSARGLGGVNVSGTADITASSINASASAFYLANRFEIGGSHSVSYDRNNNEVASSRSTLQFAGSLSFADGVFAIGRPINDAFAIVKGHKTLGDAEIYVDNQNDTYSAKSDFLGPALLNNISSYSDRTVRYNVPNAPAGYNVGDGSFRVRPPYRAGYTFIVGSEYTKTIFGTMLDNGNPLAFASGTATSLSDEAAPPVRFFTNRVGRFGATGLNPGRWRVEMNTSPPLIYILDVPEGESNLVRLGEIEPE